MRFVLNILKNTVRETVKALAFAGAFCGFFAGGAFAQEAGRLDALFADLSVATSEQAADIASEISLELSKSGSPAMDFLLRRGSEALERGEFAVARDHFSALIDHAPDFAEGWHLRAVARARDGYLGAAIADIERTLALEPRHFTALFSLGSILEELEDYDLAENAYEAALVIHPHEGDTQTALERLRDARDTAL